MPLKVYINRPIIVGPWGGGNEFVKAFFTHAKDNDIEIVPPDDHMTPPDVAMLIALDDDAQSTGLGLARLVGYKSVMESQGEKFKIVLRVNENDARKGTDNVDKMWKIASQYVDGTVWVSEWLANYYGNSWRGSNCQVIRNGVNREIFKPGERIADDPRLHIVTHHWSNNPKKGFDIYDALDEYVGKHSDEMTFTYIGRERGSFKNAKLVKPLFGRFLGAELGKYDVYVSASRFEPGPNHVVESISCGLPTYVHVDGGGGVEFAGMDHTYSGWNELESLLSSGKFTANSIEPIDWKESIRQYADFIHEVYEQ